MPWIKMRHDLPDDPDVIGIGVALGIPPEHVVGCLLRVWTVADLHAVSRLERYKSNADDVTHEGFLSYYTVAMLDTAARVEGFAQAMAAVGWLNIYEDGIGFPDCEIHNGRSAKTRACTAKRVANLRSRQARSVTPMSHQERYKSNADSVTREEKIRGEKNTEDNTPLPPLGGTPLERSPRKSRKAAETVPIPAALDTNEFKATWADWLADRAARRKPLTERAAKQQLENLTPLGPALAAECIRTSIANGWTGLFPERFMAPPQTPGSGDSLDDKIARAQERVAKMFGKED